MISISRLLALSKLAISFYFRVFLAKMYGESVWQRCFPVVEYRLAEKVCFVENRGGVEAIWIS